MRAGRTPPLAKTPRHDARGLAHACGSSAKDAAAPSCCPQLRAEGFSWYCMFVANTSFDGSGAGGSGATAAAAGSQPVDGGAEGMRLETAGEDAAAAGAGVGLLPVTLAGSASTQQRDRPARRRGLLAGSRLSDRQGGGSGGGGSGSGHLGRWRGRWTRAHQLQHEPRGAEGKQAASALLGAGSKERHELRAAGAAGVHRRRVKSEDAVAIPAQLAERMNLRRSSPVSQDTQVRPASLGASPSFS